MHNTTISLTDSRIFEIARLIHKTLKDWQMSIKAVWQMIRKGMSFEFMRRKLMEKLSHIVRHVRLPDGVMMVGDSLVPYKTREKRNVMKVRASKNSKRR